jgi:hypothetical protein
MRILVVLVVAYLITGAIYVAGDLKEHVVRQPAYAREYTQRGKMQPLILAVFAWLPVTFLRRRFFLLAIFAFLAVLGLYLSGI